MGMQLFRRKNYQDFSDIDALAVSMSEKFFAQLSFKKARFLFSHKVNNLFVVGGEDTLHSETVANAFSNDGTEAEELNSYQRSHSDHSDDTERQLHNAAFALKREANSDGHRENEA